MKHLAASCRNAGRNRLGTGVCNCYCSTACAAWWFAENLFQVKHDGHTISVSDIWFVAHHMKKLSTMTGTQGRQGRVAGFHAKKIKKGVV